MPRSFLRLRRLAPALVEIVEVGELQRLVDNRREIAAVIRIDRRLERHRRRRNEVFLAQPHGIDAGDARRFLHHAFKCVVRFRPPGAAIGSDRHGVAEVAGNRSVDLRDPVHAGQAAREIVGVDADAGSAHIGALVAQCRTRKRQEFALFVDRQLGLGNGVARLRIGDESLRTRRLPMHRPAEFARRHQQRDIFGIDRRLHAEGAADILGDHAQLFVRHAHDRRRLAAQRSRRSASRRTACSCRSPCRRRRWRRASPCEATTMRWLTTRHPRDMRRALR